MISPWNEDALFGRPQIYPAAGFDETGVEAIFFDGPNWRGRPTRVFAWLARPAGPVETPAPGMVLVHGGGGTAFAEWARLWALRGYFAIAMDTCGCTVGGKHADRPRHEWGGPAGGGVSIPTAGEPPQDQWMYHAVAAVTRSRSVLTTQPGADAGRIGVTGISWGGVVAATAASLDPGFAAAVLVYGCGFLGRDSATSDRLAKLSPELRQRWLDLWDPSNYLGQLDRPTSWVTGVDDFAFPPSIHRDTHRATPGTRHVCVKPRLAHGQEEGQSQPEAFAFIDAQFRGTPPPPQVVASESAGQRLVATCSIQPAQAWLVHTADRGRWQERRWQTTPAHVSGETVAAEAPADASAAYLHIEDERGLQASGELAL